jgi:squalene-hopene/tetraprenyl-beta-curcumene cyclase
MPAELVLLPSWFPINIYEMSSWARGTVVPLVVLMAKRPYVPIPAEQGVDELWVNPPAPADYAFPPDTQSLLSWRNFFLGLDRVLKLLGKSPVKPLRERALRKCADWILSHQDVNGGWGGIQPAMVNSVMALRVLGLADDHPAVAKGIQAIEDFVIEEGDQLFFQPCVSPTWDTALAAKALLDSGMAPDAPMLQKASEWLIENQIFAPGDWSIKNPDLEPGGWAFEFANDWYPDTDDTAVILMVLKRIAATDEKRKQRALVRGLNWTLGMQSRNGGWGAFDTDNLRELFNKIPFADMEAMLDQPTADLTGRHLELMGDFGYDLEMRPAKRGLAFLKKVQEPNGSWWGRWGVNYIYGTWSVLAGLRSIGEDLRQPYVRQSVAWLKSRQNDDGGWGRPATATATPRSAAKARAPRRRPPGRCSGCSRGRTRSAPSWCAASSNLALTQQGDGTWDELHFTRHRVSAPFLSALLHVPELLLRDGSRALPRARRSPRGAPGSERTRERERQWDGHKRTRPCMSEPLRRRSFALLGSTGSVGVSTLASGRALSRSLPGGGIGGGTQHAGLAEPGAPSSAGSGLRR